VKSAWEDALILEKGEKVIQSWEGNYEIQEKAMVNAGYGPRSTTVKKKKNGILALTNRKLVFIEERGIFSISYHHLISIPIESLGGISMGGFVSKYVSISDSQKEYIFHLGGVDEEGLGSFKKILNDQAITRKKELEAEKKKERFHVMLDFSFLKNYMDKGGLNLQILKCPECGAKIKLPESGDQTTCQHCRSTIYAQDIFEKVKALIG